jgi:hypothetical protein
MAAPERARPPPQGLDMHWAANRGVVTTPTTGATAEPPRPSGDAQEPEDESLDEYDDRTGPEKGQKGNLVSAPWPSKKAVIGNA